MSFMQSKNCREAEGELSLSGGDYLLVWSGGEPQGGYLDAELLDGRRGLVPAAFVQRLVGDDLLEFHQAVLSTLRDAEDGSLQCDTTSMPSLPPNNPLLTHTQEDLARLSESQTEIENESDIDDTGKQTYSIIYCFALSKSTNFDYVVLN
ncbi:uncharacterized protein LOC129942356 [Eupeodes corollae]|uniref:uncharacterized protein LOC129942356 n=1 Tax=Eupeodes corollae TaxID=290404 RepID=UPI002490BBCB|nr:uncharacterized protein LOC129942356 [Eupeodes corollae]